MQLEARRITNNLWNKDFNLVRMRGYGFIAVADNGKDGVERQVRTARSLPGRPRRRRALAHIGGQLDCRTLPDRGECVGKTDSTSRVGYELSDPNPPDRGIGGIRRSIRTCAAENSAGPDHGRDTQIVNSAAGTDLVTQHAIRTEPKGVAAGGADNENFVTASTIPTENQYPRLAQGGAFANPRRLWEPIRPQLRFHG